MVGDEAGIEFLKQINCADEFEISVIGPAQQFLFLGLRGSCAFIEPRSTSRPSNKYSVDVPSNAKRKPSVK